MNQLGTLVENLACAAEPDDQARLLDNYFSALSEIEKRAAAKMLAGSNVKYIKLALLRTLLREQIDDTLYALSQKFVGDTHETIALLWPSEIRANRDPSPSDVAERLQGASPSTLPKLVQELLGACDAPGRNLLVRFMTGSLKNCVRQPHLVDVLSAHHLPTPANMPKTAPHSAQADLFARQIELTPGVLQAVLLYVEKGRSRTSPLICTFGVWGGDELIPVGRAKAGSAKPLIEEFARVSAIRRFGPATEVQHSAEAAMVLNVAHDGVETSNRRKAGLTLMAPRILSVAEGTSMEEASHIEDLSTLLPPR